MSKHAQEDCPSPIVRGIKEIQHLAGMLHGASYTPGTRVAVAASIVDQAQALLVEYVAASRAAGATWAAIASDLGVTKQAAQQRYGRG